MQDLWDAKIRNLWVITAEYIHSLLKSQIDIGEFEKKIPDILIFDENSIKNGPDSIFSKNEIDGLELYFIL